MSLPGSARRALLGEVLDAVERLQARADAPESQRAEPNVIIGFGPRCPGGATTPEGYRRVLRESEPDVARMGRENQGSMRPVREFSIVPAVGAFVLMGRNWKAFSTVKAPMASAARTLHDLTPAMHPGHFVMFSSDSSVLGLPGRAKHAAANAFGHHRRLEGPVTLDYPAIAAPGGFLAAALAPPPIEKAASGAADPLTETMSDESDDCSEDELAQRLTRTLAGRR